MRLTIRSADDFHVHLREGSRMPLYAQETARCFARALVMPNTLPPIATPAEVVRYRDEILAAAPGFEPLMTFYAQSWMKREHLEDLARAGVVAGKFYPMGATTNSEAGAREIRELFPVFDQMQRLDLVLCVHAEDPAAPALEREGAFLPSLRQIVESFPLLRVVVEHISTADALAFVLAGPETLAATVTAHHLLLTLDDILGEKLNPHAFCKPVVKSAAEREALREGVFSGNPKLFFGSDSAPHPREAKESGAGAAGVYSAPVALPLLAELFEQYGALDRLENFVSVNGARFYRLPPNSGVTVLEKDMWKIPADYHGVVPMYAGRFCAWRVMPPRETGAGREGVF